jgi:hypothetical protein
MSSIDMTPAIKASGGSAVGGGVQWRRTGPDSRAE